MVREYRSTVRTRDDREVRELVQEMLEVPEKQDEDRVAVIARMAEFGEVAHG